MIFNLTEMNRNYGKYINESGAFGNHKYYLLLVEVTGLNKSEKVLAIALAFN